MVDDADRAQDEIEITLAQARSAAQARQIATSRCGRANCFATKSAPWILKNVNAD